MTVEGNKPVKDLFIAVLETIQEDVEDSALSSKVQGLKEGLRNDESKELNKTSVSTFTISNTQAQKVAGFLKDKYPTLYRILLPLLDDYTSLQIVVAKKEEK